jgi:hypothetical protein
VRALDLLALDAGAAEQPESADRTKRERHDHQPRPAVDDVFELGADAEDPSEPSLVLGPRGEPRLPAVGLVGPRDDGRHLVGGPRLLLRRTSVGAGMSSLAC